MTGHTDPLAPLLADGVIDDVVARLKSGKEADLYIVRHAGEAIAAKVYKARHVRSFKNDAGYREGRQVRDTRTQRAMDRGSRFGKAAAEEAWKAKEADALHALHAAGVRVPRPVMFYEGVLLMELVVDRHGHPAPRLIDAQVGREQAAAMYADLRGQAIRMLCSDLIHGDLSPYNVLVGAQGAVVIDFPQVVGAAHNSQAEGYFRRDLENLRHFFAQLDPALDAAAGDAREVWRAYVRRELTPDFVPTGREPAPAERPHHAAERRGGERAPHAGRAHGTGHDPHGQAGRAPAKHPQGPRPQGTSSHAGPPHPAQAKPAHPTAAHPKPSHGRHPQGGHGQGGRRGGQDERGQGGRGGQDARGQGERGQGGRGQGGRGQSGRGGHGGHGGQGGQGGQGEPRGGRPGQRGGAPERGRGPDRRRPPAPEVVRVVRPPLGPAKEPGATPPEPHRGQAGAPPQRPPTSGGPSHRGRRPWRR